MEKGLYDRLDSLSNSNIEEKNPSIGKVFEVDINKIQVDKNQPRKSFDDNLINELATSIENVGIISPIVVSKKGEFYQIVSGERRFRASRKANLKTIPVILKECDELKLLEISLIENIQREDLNSIEEALTYKRLQEDFDLSQEQISTKIGKSRTTIANSMRLLKLDCRVQNFVISGELSQGHARALLSIGDKELQFEMAVRVIEENLNVRQVEKLVKKLSENLKNLEKDKTTTTNKAIYTSISNELNEILGTKVSIRNKNDKGKIEIEYYSESDLERLVYLFKQINI